LCRTARRRDSRLKLKIDESPHGGLVERLVLPERVTSAV